MVNNADKMQLYVEKHRLLGLGHVLEIRQNIKVKQKIFKLTSI